MIDTTGRTTNAHEWYQELLGAYALGALLPDEAAEFETHLATCPTCPGELRLLRIGAQAYALVAEERDPSPALRDRLWTAISTVQSSDTSSARDREDESDRMDDEGGPATDSSEHHPAAPPESDVHIGTTRGFPEQYATPTRRTTSEPLSIDDARVARNPLLGPLWTKIAAALAVVLIGSLIAWNFSLRGNDDAEGRVVGQFATTADAPSADSGGDIRYLPDRDIIVLEMHDLPALAEGEVYQLWLITGEDAPAPAVTFVPSPIAGAETIVAFAANPDQFDVLAITLEPGPIGSIEPTTKPILVASA